MDPDEQWRLARSTAKRAREMREQAAQSVPWWQRPFWRARHPAREFLDAAVAIEAALAGLEKRRPAA